MQRPSPFPTQSSVLLGRMRTAHIQRHFLALSTSPILISGLFSCIIWMLGPAFRLPDNCPYSEYVQSCPWRLLDFPGINVSFRVSWAVEALTYLCFMDMLKNGNLLPNYYQWNWFIWSSGFVYPLLLCIQRHNNIVYRIRYISGCHEQVISD